MHKVLLTMNLQRIIQFFRRALQTFLLLSQINISSINTVQALSSSITHQFQLGKDQQHVSLDLHKVHLRQHDNIDSTSSSSSCSPWCYALTVNPIIPDDDDEEKKEKEDTLTQKFSYNFLASQVWPSARVAAKFCEEYIPKHMNVCELGCGPALPSLTMANRGINVVATDIDELALQMAEKAAMEQQIEEHFTTKYVDLMGDVSVLKTEIDADLYVLSDVFESKGVAIGAAGMTFQALKDGCRVWAFAQSDRGLREEYKDELRRLLTSFYERDLDLHELEWETLEKIEMSSKIEKNALCDRLLLLDFDETQVNYS